MRAFDSDANLKNNLANGNVVAFVGAGLSVGAGLPDWYSLMDELSSRVSYELPPPRWATREILIEAAQNYINQEGLNSLIRFLKGRLDTTGIQPSSVHRALASLPISLVFTTNFDDLLERAYRQVGTRVRIAVRDTAIPYLNQVTGIVNVIKLYGDLDQPGTLVLSRQQHTSFFTERPQLIKLLETEMARSDMLYLGWSHQDLNFNLVFGEMMALFGRHMRPGFAVMRSVTEAQRRELDRKLIRLVELPPGEDFNERLAGWLARLKA